MFDQRERRELEKRMKEQKRLPPGQSATIKFPVLHYGPVPRVDLARWDFRVFGLVVEEQRWSWEAFNQLPRSQITLDIHCVTRWSKFDTLWEGVSVATLVKEGFIRPRPEARYVIQHCEYGYTTNTPIDFVLQEGFILATHFDGQPLSPDHSRRQPQRWPPTAHPTARPRRRDVRHRPAASDHRPRPRQRPRPR